MAKKVAADVEELLNRAEKDIPGQDHRYVYSESSPRTSQSYVVRPNRKAVGRRVSTFYIILILFCFGIAIVAYINNIIVVNRLSAEINQLQMQYDKLSNSNAVLRAEINRKSGWDRIGKIANEQIGLRYPAEQPNMFDVDEDLMDRVQNTPR